MQVLFILILIYNIYFGCLICETLRFPKLYTVGTFTSPRNCVILPITGLDNEFKRDESNHYWNTCSYYSIQQFATNKSVQVKTEKLIPKRYYCKDAKKSSRSYFRMNISRMHQRKLLGYERNFREQIPGRYKFNGMHQEKTTMKKSRLTEKKRSVAEKQTEPHDDDTDFEVWDNWSNWSTCSVTCGQGRQVRWHHCLIKDCIKGLKKAQLKSYRLKNCNTKGFLGWFGIKSRSI